MEAQCKEKLRCLKMASVNIYNLNYCVDDEQEFNCLLEKIIF